MRWRFVDKITAMDPWRRITGIKAIGLEEYCLLEPLGREYVLPESLVIECCVELARWLVTASSSFSLIALLSEIDGFAFARPAEGGEVLEIHANLLGRSVAGVSVECSVMARGRAVAAGRLTLDSLPLLDGPEREELAGRWRELHASA
jgi:3-hydroxymyristoyl/3-hydroxydecanoyl-(acyl carrier protein) dehydratase